MLDTSIELFDQHLAISLRVPFFTRQTAVADMVSAERPAPSSASSRWRSTVVGWTETEGEDANQRQFHDADDSWLDETTRKLPVDEAFRRSRSRRDRRGDG